MSPNPGATAPARSGRLLLGFALVVLAALSYVGSRERNPSREEVAHLDLSPEQEVALGPQSAPALAEDLGGLDADESIQREAREVGGRLVTQSATATALGGFEFQVLADPRTVNAFALPGGSILITRGLYSRLRNEAELAGVLGHEIGHVIAGHSAQQAARAALAESAGTASDADPRSLSERFLALRFGRRDELAADALGIELMTGAGYDPRALVGVMEILARNDSGDRRPEFARTHPDPGDRAASIGEEIARRFPEGLAADLATGRALSGSAPTDGF